MKRYGIPNDQAFGVSMGLMQKFANKVGKDHKLATALWSTGWYEARTLAVYVAEPNRVTKRQMSSWANSFDNWAICDTACFHLFDRTPFAWEMVEKWTGSSKYFVKRAGFALVWSLSVHDKASRNVAFRSALHLIENTPPDDRPLVNKAINMALRATGKRNSILNKAAIQTATRLAGSDASSRAWIGKHALRELKSNAVQCRLQKSQRR